MSHCRFGFVVFACCLLVSVAAQAEQQEYHEDDIAFMATASSITASGAPGTLPGSYTVELEYHPADPKVGHKAMIVYAEPSHTLLLVLWNGNLDDPDFDEKEYRDFLAMYEALAGAVETHGSGHARVHVLYDPAGDTHIEVQTMDELGSSRVVSAPALAKDGSFGMTTFFQEVAGGGDPKTWWKHC